MPTPATASQNVIILGIDPGSRHTGYGLIHVGRAKITHLDHGTIHCPSGDLAERLSKIFEGLSTVAQTHRPHEAAIEQVFIKNNPQSALKLGQARGAALVALAQNAIPVSEYAPKQIKLAAAGHGNASKEQVQKMVKMQLALRETPQEDAADALAIALCHAHTRQLSQQIQKAIAKGSS